MFYHVLILACQAGPSLGPVLGGVLSNYLGWRYVLLDQHNTSFSPIFRSIFWFLCIATSICLIVMILYAEESVAYPDVIEHGFLSDSFRRRCGQLSMMAA